MGDGTQTKHASQDPRPPLVVGGQSDPSYQAQSPRQPSDTQSQNHHRPHPSAFSSQFPMAQPSTSHPPTFNLSVMSATLPQIPYSHGGQYQPGYNSASGSAGVLHIPRPHHHAVQGPHLHSQTFYPQQVLTGQPYYPVPVYQAHPASGVVHSRQNLASHQAQLPPSALGPVAHAQQIAYYYPPSSHSHPISQHASRQYATYPVPEMDPRTAPPVIVAGSGSHVSKVVSHGLPGNLKGGTRGPESAIDRQAVVRGPPRKPKQRGHAVWIGNLPPHTDLMGLVNHVCKEAPGLESLFLISKSNCAFANFKDEQTCVLAQQKLHDSRFHSVRLVSRLRKGITERPGAGPQAIEEATSTSSPAPASETPMQECEDGGNTQSNSTVLSPLGKTTPQTLRGEGREKERYFILKSLTVEDLEISVRNGIWATQSHNEEHLNAAFQSADSVYLIFSANKSGEYFGYARMTSPINEDPAAAIQFAPSAQSASAVDIPKAIPADSTEYAPKGRIVDDLARGTIFWEIDREEDDTGNEDKSDEERGGGSVDGDDDDDGPSKNWGKPFTLEWLSTARVPFYRARGLRNPWNANREVKIARDGTELEPSVGRRLVGLFNTSQSPRLTVSGLPPPGAGVTTYPPPHPRSNFDP